VTLEILNAAGETIRRYSSEDQTPPVNPDKLNIPAFWVRPPQPLSTSAGMHRWVWDLRPQPEARARASGGGGGIFGRGSEGQVLPGSYLVKLTVGGKSYTQPLKVKMDPRPQ
jgi:hypothetical protein